MDAFTQIAIQVPCFGLFAVVVWKLGTLAITKWSQGDSERTKAFVEGIGDIVSLQRNHGVALERIETKLDMAVDIRAAVKDAVDEISSANDTNANAT